MNFQILADKALRDETLTRDEARSILCAGDDELDAILDAARRVREHYYGRRVKLCLLLNAQSGICPEDCGYCSQSKVSTAPVQKYRLLPQEKIVERARAAVDAGATRFAWPSPRAEPRRATSSIWATPSPKSAPLPNFVIWKFAPVWVCWTRKNVAI